MRVCTTGYGRPFYEAMGMTFVGKREIDCGPMEGGKVTVLEKRFRLLRHGSAEAEGLQT
jgi:hypothetical protein